MVTKQEMVKAIQDLPEEATLEDGIQRLFVLLEIEKGLEDIKADRTITHEEMLERVKKWFV